VNQDFLNVLLVDAVVVDLIVPRAASTSFVWHIVVDHRRFRSRASQ
jgi:hypothetical protein